VFQIFDFRRQVTQLVVFKFEQLELFAIPDCGGDIVKAILEASWPTT